jgi:hypothetical protein
LRHGVCLPNAANIIDIAAFKFVTQNLKSDAPRVQWECAKVIRNTAHLFPKSLKNAVINLLDNSDSKSTVVRWSAANGLAQIMQCKTPQNKELLPRVESIIKEKKIMQLKRFIQKGLKNAG